MTDFRNLCLLHFSGADFVIKFDGQVCGFLEKFHFNEKDKTIEASLSVYSPLVNITKEYEPETMFRNITNGTVEQIFCNEYGLKAYRVFYGVKFLGIEGNIDVDTTNPELEYVYQEKVHFSFKSMSRLYIMPKSIHVDNFDKALDAYEKQKQEEQEAKDKKQELKLINQRIEVLNKAKKELEKDE